ncbi:MAG: hypothetical protein EA381_10515 [Planctomycetaceae bacterium]|nr:MAG: hypothetical protein EA381_10515 [Planctomycetaceae bacterium]
MSRHVNDKKFVNLCWLVASVFEKDADQVILDSAISAVEAVLMTVSCGIGGLVALGEVVGLV